MPPAITKKRLAFASRFQLCLVIFRVLLSRSLSDLTDRSEGKPVGVRFFDLLRRIVSLCNDEDRRIWPNPDFLQ